MEDILKEIKDERLRQNKKWGQQNHNLVEWIAILSEEVGEASREAVDYHFNNISKGYVNKEGNPNPTGIDLIHAFRKEMVQVAAVSVQIIECIDRNYLVHPEEVMNQSAKDTQEWLRSQPVPEMDDVVFSYEHRRGVTQSVTTVMAVYITMHCKMCVLKTGKGSAILEDDYGQRWKAVATKQIGHIPGVTQGRITFTFQP